MASTITKLVNGTTGATVTYNDTFKYQISTAFSGLTGITIEDATITDFIPNYINIVSYPPSGPSYPVKSINSVTGPMGTTLTFELGGITTEEAVSYTFDLSCRFKPGYVDNTYFFTNNAELGITYFGGATGTTSVQEPPGVTLNVIPNYVLSKVLTSPSIDPAPGSELIYTVTFKNTGNAGASISGLTIYDTVSSILPNFVELDSSVPSIGEDVSSDSYFNDTKYDQVVTVSAGATGVTFDLASLGPYYGTEYRMIVQGRVSPIATTGTTIINTAAWSQTGTTQGITSITNPVIDSSSSGSLTKYGPISGPTYPLPPSSLTPISYRLYAKNTGNQSITNFTIGDTVPPEVIVNQLYVGTYGIEGTSYTLSGPVDIQYSTNGGISYTDLGNYPQGSFISVPTNPQITNVKYILPNFPAGVAPIGYPAIDGYINTTGIAGPIITNYAQVYAGDTLLDDSSLNTNFDGIPSLQTPYKSIVSSPNPVVPGSTIIYSIIVQTDNSQIENAVIQDVLPPELTFAGVTGPHESTYYNYFATPGGKGVTMHYNLDYNSSNNTVTVNITDPEIIQQRSQIDIRFPVTVNVGAIGTIGNVAKYNAENGTTVTSNTVYTTISLSAQLAAYKQVIGALDSQYSKYPKAGFTYSGGTLQYKLTLMNAGNMPFKDIEVIDILPYIGDTGVILIDDERDSDFPVYINGNITAQTTSTATAHIQYSQSNNPTRFGVNNTTITGTPPNWSNTPPYPLSSARSFGVTLSGGTIYPGDTLDIYVPAIVPIGAVVGTTAWNSFAARALYDDGGTPLYMPPIEPIKVGIQIKGPTYPGEIGDLVFIDTNGNGIYDGTLDVGLNNVIVQLYDASNNQLVATTSTNYDVHGNPGYYLFSNLQVDPSKTYYLLFTPPLGYSSTIQNLTNLGSKPSQITGRTPDVTLSGITETNYYQYGGFIPEICETATFGECLSMLHINDKVKKVNIPPSNVTPVTTSSYLDTSNLITIQYGPPPYTITTTGYYYYVNLDLNFHIDYNIGETEDFTIPYETSLFIPIDLAANQLTVNPTVEASNFYIDGSGKGLYVTFNLTTCIEY